MVEYGPQLILLRLAEGVGEDPMERRRAVSVTARRLAEEHIGRIAGRVASVRRGANGRPLVRWVRGVDGPPPPTVSIAHAARWIGVAIFPAGGRLGVDLESIDRVPEHVAMRVMSPQDRESFLALDPVQRGRMAAQHWVLAEALAKADGAGLQLMLSRSIQLRLQHRGRWGRYRFVAGEPVDGLVCALALDRSVDIDTVLDNPLVLDIGM